ncbi:helix-turn-helix transcriptional regulator [Paenibacillus sp. GSMTC-2017]|uniref:winged helix-turn-helix transcriptional regulator n=1 Tax=Paenibacillus sp. GSMTC-2017 TaxID=2794350 RepID=UPI0018D8083F|nr:helix-turn-helix domain-containing protein [Paenibacillus sp. GSMTC-2017]MBH5317170.1 helix-turn-helix transcriptional regulator [Paenibacillus sp. GSMTC-2017]
MTSEPSKHRDPVEAAIQQIGGKWKTAILCLLGDQGKQRNGELMRSLKPITQKILTEQLKELEKDELILRTVFPEVPPKVEYELTDKGRKLEGTLHTLCEWGKQFASPTQNHDE